MDETLKKARKLLAEVTPLKTDCGRVCGARCCRPMEGEETGITFINPHFYDPKPPQKTVSADTGAKKKKFSLFGKGA